MKVQEWKNKHLSQVTGDHSFRWLWTVHGLMLYCTVHPENHIFVDLTLGQFKPDGSLDTEAMRKIHIKEES